MVVWVLLNCLVRRHTLQDPQFVIEDVLSQQVNHSSYITAMSAWATDLQQQFEVLPTNNHTHGWLGADSDISVVIGGGNRSVD